MTDQSIPPCETECPDLDDIAAGLRLIASIVERSGVTLPGTDTEIYTLLVDYADAVDVWAEVVSD